VERELSEKGTVAVGGASRRRREGDCLMTGGGAPGARERGAGRFIEQMKIVAGGLVGEGGLGSG